MVRKIQRNEPCPCGSQKKYKQCCMAKQREKATQRAHYKEGVQAALSWLSHQHRDAIDQWVEEYWLADISPEERQGIATADPRIRSIHDINLLEFLVAEGALGETEAEQSPLSLIFASESLSLDALQRAYLEQLPQHPLRLYKVTHREAGESFSVEPLGNTSSESFDIEDKWASRMFDPGDIIGLRLIPATDGWETSGAIYHIPDEHLPPLTDQLQNAEPSLHSQLLARHWLKLVAAHV